MNNPLRVLMITSEWPTTERPFDAPYLVRQVEFLRRAGVDVDVFPFRGARSPLNYVRARQALRPRLRSGNYDLIHAQFGQSALLPWPSTLPLVITFHGCDINGVKRPDGSPSAAGLFLQRACRMLARRADGVILVSDRMRQFLPRGLPATVIPTGIDFTEIPDLTVEQARRELGLPLGEHLVLFVGSPHEPVKRYWLAEQAVAALASRMPARLVLGWGYPRATILRFMKACDVLLMTSIQEGSPCVVKEALASDLPIVSLDVGDVPVRVHGLDGCEICADADPQTIAGSLERVLSRTGRVRGREAVADLDESRLTERIIGVYAAALKRDGAYQAGGRGSLSPVRDL